MHTDDKPFNCEFCQKEFRRKYDRNRHVKFVHLKPLAKLQEENGLSAENLFSLTDAAASVNQKVPVGNLGFGDTNHGLVTSLNNIAQSDLSGLALWNMRNEIEKNQEISEKPFQCDFCDSRFKRLYDKNRHIKMAHLAHLEQTDQGKPNINHKIIT